MWILGLKGLKCLNCKRKMQLLIYLLITALATKDLATLTTMVFSTNLGELL